MNEFDNYLDDALKEIKKEVKRVKETKGLNPDDRMLVAFQAFAGIQALSDLEDLVESHKKQVVNL